jgi:DNA-binding MarR family transcriptional regulator
MDFNQLKLENQICFPIYAASRLIIREYQPYLDKLGITYPQYLVLMVLWESDGIPVNEISRRLILNTNTITPLLKRMETQSLVTRQRSGEDERRVIVRLTPKGEELRLAAASIPAALVAGLVPAAVNSNELQSIKDGLLMLVNRLANTETNDGK